MEVDCTPGGEAGLHFCVQVKVIATYIVPESLKDLKDKQVVSRAFRIAADCFTDSLWHLVCDIKYKTCG